MSRIIRSGECRNSPKNAAMEEIAIEIFASAHGRLLERLTDNVVLYLGDGTLIEGKEAAHQHIVQSVQRDFETLKIDHAITHGRVGAANGALLAGGHQTGFCVVVEFANMKADRLHAIKLYGV